MGSGCQEQAVSGLSLYTVGQERVRRGRGPDVQCHRRGHERALRRKMANATSLRAVSDARGRELRACATAVWSCSNM